MDMKMKPEDDQKPFFSEGAYGCVMYPRIDCHGNKKKITKVGVGDGDGVGHGDGKGNKKKEMSKIVKNDFTAENEVILGKKLNKINKKAKKMIFLPVTRSCPIMKEKVEKYKECHFFSDEKHKHVDKYKILYATYVESQTIYDYLYEHRSPNPYAHLQKMVDYYCFMVKAVGLLSDHGVIHNDLNMKNVLVASENNKMHVIDFGRSIMTKKMYYKNNQLNMKYLKHFFSIWDPTRFFYWPVEHYILSYFVREEKKMDRKTLIQIIEHYYDNDKNKPLYLKKEQDRRNYIKVVYTHYEEKFVNDLSYKTHIKDILNNATKTWDLYAISYICFKFIMMNKKNVALSKMRWFTFSLNDSLHYDYLRRNSMIVHEENVRKLKELML